MKRKCLLLMLFVSSFFLAGSLQAEDYTVYIHGFGTADFTKYNNTGSNGGYWSDDDHKLGGATVHVGYKAFNSPTGWGEGEAQRQIYTVMRNRCRAPNNCKVVCHSMGCLAFGYFNAQYNRNYTYRVNQVISLASAEGGSEFASLGVGILRIVFGNKAIKKWMGGLYGLRVSKARRSYNHNDAHHTAFYHYAGRKENKYRSWMLPGKDDSTVAFHSACSYRRPWHFNRCHSKRYSKDWRHRRLTWKKKCKGKRWWKVCWKYPRWRAIKVYMHSNHYRAPSSGNRGVKASHTQFNSGSKYHKL